MKMNITTGRLPLPFLMIGSVITVVGIIYLWTDLMIGAILFIAGVLFTGFKSGVTLDIPNKQLKEYVGLLALKIGKWQNIDTAVKLEIRKSEWSQEYNVKSLSTVTTVPTSSLYLHLSDKKIQLMQAKKQRVLKRAETLAQQLNIPLENHNR